jgi:hypothetical protein
MLPGASPKGRRSGDVGCDAPRLVAGEQLAQAVVTDDIAVLACCHRKQCIVKIRTVDCGADDLAHDVRRVGAETFLPLRNDRE